ncbi:hypothetical protein FDECE_12472 [Fusarium decemcellulare]|nr:hypothetical protein FDECE_12472 [Fusarium decemcellulare]
MSTSSDSSSEEATVRLLHIPSNPYATAYKSNWTLPESGILDDDDMDLLEHVNCSYLSSPRPPTLLALKQHAQSLTHLIRKLVPSNSSGSVGDSIGDTHRNFRPQQAFDWLSDLDEPYENADSAHQYPLWAIANTVKEESDVDGIEHHCPLTRVPDTSPGAEEGTTRRPYMTHHDLVMHANECLEILDHEYSATGGLMSLLPIGIDGDVDSKQKSMSEAQLAGARNTLLGQWLLHHQHLVGRMHELEINYANALDLLAGEAHVPLQLMHRSGTDGVSGGREVGYPQDKFILANAGDDVTDYIHRLLDVNEAQIEQKQKIWKESGVSGERMWYEERGGKWYAKGLVPIDLPTRFYRIKGKGHQSPIFVLPAVEHHPGIQHTRRMEERPTVVSIVTPSWPERVSAWEMKNKAQLEEAAQIKTQNQALVRERLELKDILKMKDAEISRQRTVLASWETNYSSAVSRMDVYKRKMDQLKEALPERYHDLLSFDEEGG